ncbi:MAG TPA: alpha-glucan family phosphorylase [Thermoplasmata archaeon]|nr:alpha-glucan family phosphorylase [Thermoplasmata archaeon]
MTAADEDRECKDGRVRTVSVLPYNPKVAYFSMEIGINPEIPSYSGGLGILAGDTVKSCADLNVPMVAITLLSEKGYFDQRIDENGNQIEMPVQFSPSSHLTLIARETMVTIEGKPVKIRPWYYLAEGVSGYRIPVIFLDTNMEENGEWERTLTKYLYGEDERYRLAQEIILGIGGFRMLKELGFTGVYRFHMNEGHASLLTLEIYNRTKNVDYVRKQCVFTTHTPVPAGHDQFDLSLARSLLGDMLPEEIIPDVTFENKLNMTKLGLFFSHYINGVAKKHGEVSREMFPGYSIDSITNGVHSITWVSESFQKLFDKYMPGWRFDPYTLRSAFSIPKEEIWNAHMEAKKQLIDFVNETTNVDMSYEVFTIGFARRQTSYKRPDLLISDPDQLMRIAEKSGPMQIIYAGKAHPKDVQGKEIIRKIFQVQRQFNNSSVKIVFLENYDMWMAQRMVAGVDLWLNTPRRPMEASGTSGMKAAHNGVPQLSTLDGWWIEGHIENITGWSIGSKRMEGEESDDDRDRDDLYNKLENKILPKFYNDRENWIRTMRSCIAINASFFNTHRMVEQYVLNAYFL